MHVEGFGFRIVNICSKDSQVEGPRGEVGVGVISQLPAQGGQGCVQVVGAAVVGILHHME